MLDEADIAAIAERAADRAVRGMLTTLGIDVDDPLAAQKDFAILREVGDLVRDPEFRKDIEHMRSWRLAMNEVKVNGIRAAVGILVTGALGALWIGFKSFLPGVHLP